MSDIFSPESKGVNVIWQLNSYFRKTNNSPVEGSGIIGQLRFTEDTKMNSYM